MFVSRFPTTMILIRARLMSRIPAMPILISMMFHQLVLNWRFLHGWEARVQERTERSTAMWTSPALLGVKVVAVEKERIAGSYAMLKRFARKKITRLTSRRVGSKSL